MGEWQKHYQKHHQRDVYFDGVYCNVLSVRMLELIFCCLFLRFFAFFLIILFLRGMRGSRPFRWGGGEIIWGGGWRRGRCSTR